MKTVATELTRITAGIAILTSLAFSCTYKEFVSAVEAQHLATQNTAIIAPANFAPNT